MHCRVSCVGGRLFRPGRGVGRVVRLIVVPSPPHCLRPHHMQPLGKKIDLKRFTLDRYRGIVKYKTAFYSFYLPVALGMIVSGINDAALYDKAREILMIMGEYFQVQDDYLDCYGAPEVRCWCWCWCWRCCWWWLCGRSAPCVDGFLHT